MYICAAHVKYSLTSRLPRCVMAKSLSLLSPLYNAIRVSMPHYRHSQLTYRNAHCKSVTRIFFQYNKLFKIQNIAFNNFKVDILVSTNNNTFGHYFNIDYDLLSLFPNNYISSQLEIIGLKIAQEYANNHVPGQEQFLHFISIFTEIDKYMHLQRATICFALYPLTTKYSNTSSTQSSNYIYMVLCLKLGIFYTYIGSQFNIKFYSKIWYEDIRPNTLHFTIFRKTTLASQSS